MKDLPTPDWTGVGERAPVANASVAEVVAEVGAKKTERYTKLHCHNCD